MYYNLFFVKWGFFLKVLSTKHAIFKFYGSWLREATKTWRVVAVTHGDNPQYFLVAKIQVTRKSLGSLLWLKATTLKKMLSPDDQKNLRLSPWVQATTLNFVVLIGSLNYDPYNWNIACFLAKTFEKNPYKKIDYRTFLALYSL